jgi:hypothetical protein
MKLRSFNILILLSVLFLSFTTLSGQEKISPYIQIKYVMNSGNERFLQTALTYSKNRMELPVPGMEIKFFAGSDKQTLPTAITNEKGIAEIRLSDEIEIPSESDGSLFFYSEYAGNDTIESGSSEISVADIQLEMTLDVVDTIKTISVSAMKVADGSETPAAGEMISVYVPRMFSLLLIGEITLDDSGSGTLEFPADLPGDKEGNVTIISKFADGSTYEIEKTETLNWGVPSEYSVPTTHRALWTKGAPKWMIYTLTILLTGVWAHYLFAIISLIRIKIAARKEAEGHYKS